MSSRSFSISIHNHFASLAESETDSSKNGTNHTHSIFDSPIKSINKYQYIDLCMYTFNCVPYDTSKETPAIKLLRRCIGHVYYVIQRNYGFRSPLPRDTWLKTVVEHPHMYFNERFIQYAITQAIDQELICKQFTTNECIEQCVQVIEFPGIPTRYIIEEQPLVIYGERIVRKAKKIKEKDIIDKIMADSIKQLKGQLLHGIEEEDDEEETQGNANPLIENPFEVFAYSEDDGKTFHVGFGTDAPRSFNQRCIDQVHYIKTHKGGADTHPEMYFNIDFIERALKAEPTLHYSKCTSVTKEDCIKDYLNTGRIIYNDIIVKESMQ
jgi:hypothetical protein